jgi:hypothetical protein
MNDIDLDKQRDEVIEKIKLAFPTSIFTGKLYNNDLSYTYENERLTEMLSGKNWLEVVSNQKVFYYLSDVDFLRAITGDAYHYYLPALLTASLIEPDRLFYSQSTYQQISEIATSLTVKQVKAIIGYLECQEKYHIRVMGVSSMLPDAELEAIQGTYLRLLNLLYELGSRAMRDE